MTTRTPCVSVCLPVYNGERHIREAIRSILKQTFEDFELIISDNASTDGTQEICREVTARDDRLRYFRADANRGLAWNFNRAFELATGRYLVWMCHDDSMATEYISRCVEALERDAGAVVCFTNANYIDDKGHLINRADLKNPAASERPSERFHNILYDNGGYICGLMKTEVLKQTRLHGAYADSDRVLLAELGLRGRFRLIPDYLFSRRMYALQTTTKYRDRWDRTLIFDPSKAGKASCPWVREFVEFVAAIRRTPLCCTERLRCYKYLYWWSTVHRRFLSQDLRHGLRCTTRRIMMRPVVD
jgi:glycosyltransferase involved in cell wall biosynthesis